MLCQLFMETSKDDRTAAFGTLKIAKQRSSSFHEKVLSKGGGFSLQAVDLLKTKISATISTRMKRRNRDKSLVLKKRTATGAKHTFGRSCEIRNYIWSKWTMAEPLSWKRKWQGQQHGLWGSGKGGNIVLERMVTEIKTYLLKQGAVT